MAAPTQVTDRIRSNQIESDWNVIAGAIWYKKHQQAVTNRFAAPRSCSERTWPEPWCRSAQIPRIRPGLPDYERSAAWRSSGWSLDRFKTWRTCTLAVFFWMSHLWISLSLHLTYFEIIWIVLNNGWKLNIHWVSSKTLGYSQFWSNQRFELWHLLYFLAEKDSARSFAVHGMSPKANSGCAETSAKVSVEWLPFSRAIGSCSQLSRSRDEVDGSSVFLGWKEERKGWHSLRNLKNTQELSWSESSWVELSVAESI